MRIYQDDNWPAYKALKLSAPKYYDEVEEMQAMYRVEGGQLDEIKSSMIQAVDDCYIRTASEPAISDYESLFKIRPYNPYADLEFRRRIVASFFIMGHHIGAPEILQLCELFAPNGNAYVRFKNSYIELGTDAYIEDEETFLSTLLMKIPAHLGFALSLYRTYRYEIPLSVGAGIRKELTAGPVPANRSAKMEIPMRTAAAGRHVTRASVMLHKRIISKRID